MMDGEFILLDPGPACTSQRVKITKAPGIPHPRR
ncbi:hypothetical protein J2S55_005370 [Streptosporangium brasiliense]|uniref:MBL fold metallo-hydrolase n=1 Tax=Streptosporangium brasiliense TaxID=47480 RepID=A0ABT9RBE4_9ACTN|nr:hypothetical protein [Streptosporangium brasiliense]